MAVIKVSNVKENLPEVIKVTASGSVKTVKIKK
jgi:hypothetical protein